MAKGKDSKKLLVTGCSGFIGRHVVAYALKNGYDVVGFDMKPLERQEKNFTFIKGDIMDKGALEKAASGCTHFIHLAACTSLPDFQYNLFVDYGANVIGFMNAIEAAHKNKCKKFVYASSSAVYEKEYSEDSILDVKTLRNHYGKSKLMDEMIADSYIDAYKLDTVGLRYFNLYGPGEEVKLMCSPVTKFLMEMREKDTITLFGDGKQAKDFIYIDDAIKITFMLMESKKSIGVYNVGTGIATQFIRVAELLKPGKILYTPNPYLSSYIFYLKADTRRLLKEIGDYRFVTIEEGVSRLLKGK